MRFRVHHSLFKYSSKEDSDGAHRTGRSCEGGQSDAARMASRQSATSLEEQSQSDELAGKALPFLISFMSRHTLSIDVGDLRSQG